MKTSFLKDFREFISRGNVIDLAVGVVIGAAFGKIVDSLVKDVIMPPVGYLINGVDFTNLHIDLGKGVTLNYGNFIQTLVQFVIVAFSIFLMVKAVKWLKDRDKKDDTKPNETPLPTNEEKLLTEIRDILKRQA